MTRGLGILTLENAPLRLGGAMGNPDTFSYPTVYRTVAGASVERVVRADPDLGAAYVAAARALEREGVAAITTNCGFSVVYQAQLSAAVAVPVATSSLLLLPWMARLVPDGRKIGVVTYEARSLTAAHLLAAGMRDEELPVTIAGIDGTAVWAELARPEPRVSVDELERDVLSAVNRVLTSHPEIQLLLLECAAFCPLTPSVRAKTRRPAFDFVTLANLLMASVAGPGLAAAPELSHRSPPRRT